MRIGKRFSLCFILITAVVLFAGNILYAAVSQKTEITSISASIGKRDVTKKNYKMSVGDAVTLRVSVKPKKAASAVSFRSSKPKVVSVSKNGKITALKKGTARITLMVSGKKYKKASTYVKISVQSSNDNNNGAGQNAGQNSSGGGSSQSGQNSAGSGNGQSNQNPSGNAEKITEYVNENTLVRDVMNDPIFKDYGRLLFPVDQTISSNLTLGKVENILTWYHHVDPAATVEIINTLMTRAAAGETVFYDIYTDEEKKADPDKENTGLFFFKGTPGAKFAVMNAGGGFAYVGAMHDSFPAALELSKKGYHAFALIYRSGGQERACEDLARAISVIFDRADELQVDTSDYSLWGGSAGARMAAVLGADGPAAHGGSNLPQPAAVITQYTGHSMVSSKEPPTYACVGTNDGIADYRTMQKRIDRIRAQGTDAEIEVFDGLPHGFGLGTGTAAEGWIHRAVSFWEAHMKTKPAVSQAFTKNTRNIPEELFDIPDNYKTPAEHAGQLVRLDYETYESMSYDSREKKLTKTAYVYLPYGYTENKKYNVFYQMHGGWSNETTTMGTEDNPTMLRNAIDHAIEDGIMQPLILVMPTYNNESRSDSGDYSLALQLTRNYHNELVNDLIPAVEGKYSTYATDTTKEGIRASRDHRAFGGFSMGSVATWRTFEYCLDYFRYFLPMSGALTSDGRYMDTIVKASGYAWDDFFIYAVSGTDDFAYSAFRSQIASMRTQDSFRYADNEAEGNLTLRVREGYTHDATASSEYTYNGLLWFWNS